MMKKNTKGFTLVEVMISMAIFTVLVVVGIGSVLDATAKHNRNQGIRTIMDNLNFVMEDMARNIRLGSNPRCITSGTGGNAGQSLYSNISTFDVQPDDCTSGSNKIAFNSVTHDPVIIYTVSPVSPYPIYKEFESGGVSGAPRIITPPEVTIDPLRSGFTVTSSKKIKDNDFAQPVVTIRLAGTVTYKEVESPFAIQTTVTLRQLDS